MHHTSYQNFANKNNCANLAYPTMLAQSGFFRRIVSHAEELLVIACRKHSFVEEFANVQLNLIGIFLQQQVGVVPGQESKRSTHLTKPW